MEDKETDFGSIEAGSSILAATLRLVMRFRLLVILSVVFGSALGFFYGLTILTIVVSWWLIRRSLPEDHLGIRHPRIHAAD